MLGGDYGYSELDHMNHIILPHEITDGYKPDLGLDALVRVDANTERLYVLQTEMPLNGHEEVCYHVLF